MPCFTSHIKGPKATRPVSAGVTEKRATCDEIVTTEASSADRLTVATLTWRNSSGSIAISHIRGDKRHGHNNAVTARNSKTRVSCEMGKVSVN